MSGATGCIVGAPNLAVRQMLMVMPVLIECECRRCLVAEQDPEFVAGCHIGWCSVAADMTVQANHTVGLRHDDVKVVRDQHDTAIQPVADILDQFIERNLAIIVDALNRFVENQKFRRSQYGARKQNPLKFAARQFAHLRIGKVAGLRCRECVIDLALRGAVRQLQKAGHAQRQCPVDLQLLRYIAGAQIGFLPCRSFICLQDAEGHFCSCGLARPVRSDQRDNLAGFDGHRNTANKPSVRAVNSSIVERYEHAFVLGGCAAWNLKQQDRCC